MNAQALSQITKNWRNQQFFERCTAFQKLNSMVILVNHIIQILLRKGFWVNFISSKLLLSTKYATEV
jgi:hypothetical protein